MIIVQHNYGKYLFPNFLAFSAVLCQLTMTKAKRKKTSILPLFLFFYTASNVRYPKPSLTLFNCNQLVRRTNPNKKNNSSQNSPEKVRIFE